MGTIPRVLKKRKIVKKCLFKRFNILSNWEIQVTVCLHLLSARIVMIKKTVNNCWQICWWDCKPAQPLCKEGWVILKKLIYHLTQLYHASEYAKRTWHPAPQIPAQLCPLLLYSQLLGNRNNLKVLQLMNGWLKCGKYMLWNSIHV